ncbi:hypothetical protein [Bilophila wadsworthia]|uniref:hypothetical protein n=1 Tax=Bilophila wadsworthia TaxID=35833 RepID=UPI003990DE6A
MFSDIMHGIMITMSPDCLLGLASARCSEPSSALPALGRRAITICIPSPYKWQRFGHRPAARRLRHFDLRGSISAVLLTPGTQSACTGFEGYAMAKAAKRKRPSADHHVLRPRRLFSCVALVIAAPSLRICP